MPFVTVSFVALPTELNGLQLVATLYPKVTDTVPLAGVMFLPVTLTVEPGVPDPGLLVIEAVGALTVNWLSLGSCAGVLPAIVAHTVYDVPTVVPDDGQVIVSLNEPGLTVCHVGVAEVEIGISELLQLVDVLAA